MLQLLMTHGRELGQRMEDTETGEKWYFHLPVTEAIREGCQNSIYLCYPKTSPQSPFPQPPRGTNIFFDLIVIA